MRMVTVVKIGFDTLENRESEAIYREELATFIETEDSDLSAAGKAGNYISELEPMQLYLAWNGEVYPQIKIEKREGN